MKMRKLYTIAWMCLLLAAAAFAAKKFPLTAAPSVPAARGQVEVNKDKNGNTRLRMKVEHLASPESLTPPKTTYVVWLQERGANPENQGQLRVDKNLKANFETVTPLKSFDVLVTAEQEATAKAPSDTEVLKATVQP